MRRALLALVLLSGCAHHPELGTAAGPKASASEHRIAAASAPAAGTSAGPEACSSDTDCGARQLCVHDRCVDIDASLAECRQARLHFDLDAADIRDDEKAQLERMARCLKADARMHVTVEGNADERGTEEYNMALGDRRANVVEKYLTRLGVPERQLRAVSYGEVRPLCTEHDETCWSQNRRAAIQRAAR